jgi:hypothetical protein
MHNVEIWKKNRARTKQKIKVFINYKMKMRSSKVA